MRGLWCNNVRLNSAVEYVAPKYILRAQHEIPTRSATAKLEAASLQPQSRRRQSARSYCCVWLARCNRALPRGAESQLLVNHSEAAPEVVGFILRRLAPFGDDPFRFADAEAGVGFESLVAFIADVIEIGRHAARSLTLEGTVRTTAQRN